MDISGSETSLRRPKHVWMLNHYAQHPSGAGGTRHYSLARHLPAFGWKASILAASTDHFDGQQRIAGAKGCEIRLYGGVTFLWLRATAYAGNGLGRVRNMLQYTLAALRYENVTELDRPDVILGSSVHPLAAWAGMLLARRYRVPFIFEVRDLWPQTLVDMGRLPNVHPVTFGLRLLEKALYKKAARIITLLPNASSYINRLGVDIGKIIWIPNGVDLDSFPTAAPATPAHNDTFTLMYFGAHGGANGLDNVLRAMKIVEAEAGGENIRLRLIGDGPSKPALITLARELELGRVQFEDPVPKREIPSLAAQADAFVFNLIEAQVFKYGISSNKLFDFMAAERPVIFCSSSANNPIAEAGAGITVAPAAPQALADAILALAKMPDEDRRKMAEAGRQHLYAKYSMAHLAGILAATLDTCLTQMGTSSSGAAK
jgi:glycosyltransferase involved in cell wall biosynthesis